MSTGERIRTALLEVMDGKLEVVKDEPGKCLTLLRQIVMRALGIDYETFYARYRTHITDLNTGPDTQKWSNDLMKSLREQGLRVANSDQENLIMRELEPGDLLFSFKLGEPIGHCAVLLSGGADAMAIENTGQNRGESLSGYNRLTRVDTLTLHYPNSWEAFRLPEPEVIEEVTFFDGHTVSLNTA